MKKYILIIIIAAMVFVLLAACENTEEAASGFSANITDQLATPPESDETETVDFQNIPEEYIGHWAGSVDNINLSFNVEPDGKGVYIFEQGGYTESYEFTLKAGTETFSVKIPENNALGIVNIGGTYTYSSEMLILDVKTTFADGGVFEYTVPCGSKPILSEEPPQQQFLIVSDITFQGFGQIKSIDFTDENGTSVSMPSAWNDWFVNAEVKSAILNGTISGYSDVNPNSVMRLASGSIEFVFAIDGEEHAFDVSIGAKFIVRKNEAGYLLFADEKTASEYVPSDAMRSDAAKEPASAEAAPIEFITIREIVANWEFVEPSALIGTWHEDNDGWGTVEYHFGPDGNFHRLVEAADGAFYLENKGTYSVNNYMIDLQYAGYMILGDGEKVETAREERLLYISASENTLVIGRQNLSEPEKFEVLTYFRERN